MSPGNHFDNFGNLWIEISVYAGAMPPNVEIASTAYAKTEGPAGSGYSTSYAVAHMNLTKYINDLFLRRPM